MTAKKKNNFFSAVLLVLAVFLSVPAAAAEPAALLKITGHAPALMPAIAGAGGVVVQELDSCLLVRAPRPALPRLRAAGIAFAVVTDVRDGVRFYLLHSPLAAPLAPGAGSGCRRLEGRVWLLWTADPAFRRHLTQPFRLKALDLSAPPAVVPPAAAAADERCRSGPGYAAQMAGLAAQVSAERLRADILTLQNFKTRYASTAQCDAAGAFILQRFRQLGLAAAYDPFTFEGDNAGNNIAAVIPGKVAPERIVLACAHYDSTSDTPLVLAPGANDNGSGTATILELARILAGESFDFTIVLLCVSAEEWGLYGSDHYARQARRDGDDILAVVNVDMIAHPENPQWRVLDLYGDRQSEWLVDRFISVAQPLVGLRLAKVIDPSMIWSDHSPFWRQGYSALCENEDSNDPFYHHTTDTLDKLDMTFAAEAAQASLAVVADLAQPLSTPQAPTGLRARSQVSAALFASLKTVYLDWQPNPEPVSGYHVYRADRSHGPYVRLTAQPLAAASFKDVFLRPDQAYFYVLTAVDGQGRESNFSDEVRDDENNR